MKNILILITLVSLSSLSFGQSIYYYSYDDHGQLTEVKGDSMIVKLSYDPAGNLITANTIIDTTASVNEEIFDQAWVNIYPNPAEDNIMISYSGSEKTYTLYLYDIQGKCLLEREYQNQLNSIIVSRFETGLYFLKLIAGDKVFSRKIIIHK